MIRKKSMSKTIEKIKKSPFISRKEENMDSSHHPSEVTFQDSPSVKQKTLESVQCESQTNEDLFSQNLIDVGSDEISTYTMASENTPTKQTVEYFLKKIHKVKELLKEEQIIQNDNVNEYLEIAKAGNKQQISRQRNAFEKKHLKISQNISNLMKKLEAYQKKLKELENHGVIAKPTKEVFRDVGHGIKNVGENIKYGITGLSGSMMTKPRDFATLIRNRFGSADNISNLKKDNAELRGENYCGSYTFPGTISQVHQKELDNKELNHSDEPSECSSSMTSGSAGGLAMNTLASVNSPRNLVGIRKVGSSLHKHGVNNHVKTSSEQLSPNAVIATSTFQLGSHSLETIFHELQDIRDEIEHIQQERKKMQRRCQMDNETINQGIQEEHFRVERLEEQVNDLIELHQNEMENLKTSINDMEEKVLYQNEERVRDIWEMLDACHTKISQLEHQQQQHQQLVTLEGIQNSNARAVVVKLINILLTILQVILLLLATIIGIIMPFFRTRIRILITMVMIAISVFVYHNKEEALDLCHIMYLWVLRKFFSSN